MVGETEGKSEIATILNKYKDTLDDLIDSLDIEFLGHPDSLNWLELIDKGSRNAPKSRDGLPTFLAKDCLDKNISIESLGPVLKIQDSQVHQCHNVATLVPKGGKHNMKKVSKIRKIEKVKGVKKMGKIRGVQKGEIVRKVKKAIRKIRYIW